jgi:general secretion pathway protein E
MATHLEQLLVEKGLVTANELAKAMELAGQRREPWIYTLVDEQFAEEEPVLRFIGERQGVEFVCLRETTVDDAAVRAVSARFVSYYSAMPVKLADNTLTVAISNPLDMSCVEDIQTNLGFRVDRVFACRRDILSAIRKYYGVGAETVARILDGATEPETELRVERETHDLERMAEDASVVKLVNQLVQQAIRDRATDIHFEAYDGGVAVRRRIDGVLYDTKVASNIHVLYPAIISRIKLMSGLDIVERRLPQDGRARVNIGHRKYDLRVSVIPSLHGENVVVRVLPTTMLLSLEDLGFSDDNLSTLTQLLTHPHGIIFVTGPTGSGKSTTLYACLSRLNTSERKIITIEDPVEYEIRGLSQMQVHPQIDLTFSRALRSMLRHDPDVMMVGEVRDRETAEITVQAALTGHLVFSTLHTNDAAGGPVRLMDMGVEPYLVASSVRAFAAQRLVRLICADCRESYESDGRALYRGAGCRKCSQTGYRGRGAICEILPVSDDIQALMLKRSSSTDLRQQAVASGMKTLADDGWNKAALGLTTAEEVLRVTST